MRNGTRHVDVLGELCDRKTSLGLGLFLKKNDMEMTPFFELTDRFRSWRRASRAGRPCRRRRRTCSGRTCRGAAGTVSCTTRRSSWRRSGRAPGTSAPRWRRRTSASASRPTAPADPSTRPVRSPSTAPLKIDNRKQKKTESITEHRVSPTGGSRPQPGVV